MVIKLLRFCKNTVDGIDTVVVCDYVLLFSKPFALKSELFGQIVSRLSK